MNYFKLSQSTYYKDTKRTLSENYSRMVDFHYVEAQAFDNSISQFLSTISSSQWEIAVQKASLDIPYARTRSYVAKDTVRL